MYILDVMETCNNTVLSGVLPIVKSILLLIQIIVPIALLVAFTIDFVKLSINPEEKDGFRKLLNKVIAAVIIFVIPIIINVIMGAVGESTEFSDCWNNTSSTIIGSDTYVETDEGSPYMPEPPKKADKTIPEKIVKEK